ncbi:Na/Pi cotransporter family protein [Marinococcus luteus]|uniref:Na/Pi cotransporter family protein n=1 Tax=Marinococcus luteus TaxID=1122204 RepID=UPI002ACC8FD8|nr:Na/Pi cotransporter family protein [Marinococcus luteus]MDZ5782976.1 Na/Pi cotransporter family protein [Marinococcus luteus]
MDIQTILFTFFGGLGIFLFGIKYMGDGLQKIAGDRLRDLLDKFTSNPFMGVLVGIIVTILIQSSSGTTVLTVGLVSAGFMTLRQAIGVIMGANVGTTVTAFIIGIKLEEYALPIIFIGTVMIFFFKNKKVSNIGQTFFGFGALFFGLSLMGDGVAPLEELPAFNDLTISMSNNPLLGLLVGVVFTVGLQSSSATIGLLQELYTQNAISLDAALPILFGDNIGTTVTAVIAAIGASVAAKRTALTHVIFNLIGATIILILLVPYTAFISFLQDALNLNQPMTIAFAHGIFNISNVIIQLPFVGVLAYIVTKLVPGSDEEIEYKPKHLDPSFIYQSPAIALDQAKLETLRMAEYAGKGLRKSESYLETKNKKDAEKIVRYEEAINNLDKDITDYLIGISARSLSRENSRKHSVVMDTVRDIERVGDHMENVMELVDYQLTNKVTLSEEAYKDLNEMFTLTISTFNRAVEALEKDDYEIAQQVARQEEDIDKMERKLRKKHILRLNEGRCSGSAGIVFVDMISNLERIGDHSVNIAETVLDDREVS